MWYLSGHNSSVAKAIFESPSAPRGKTIVSRNVKRLTSTGLPAPVGLKSIQFQVNPKSGKEDAIVGLKYPRGFTPERMRSIEALTQIPKDNSIRPIRIEPGEQGAKFKEIVARSALHPRQFEGLSLKVTHDSSSLPSGISGEYISSSNNVDGYSQPRGGEIILKDNPAGAVVIHELGHHFDLNPSRRSFDAEPQTIDKAARDAGISEGKADVITRKNYRPDPRVPRNINGDSNTYGVNTAVAHDHRPNKEGLASFADAYSSTGAMPPKGDPYWKNYHDALISNPDRAQSVSDRLGVPVDKILESLKSRI